jgi:hypothetical protein
MLRARSQSTSDSTETIESSAHARPGRPRKPVARPLTPDELGRCEQIARRLQAELRRVVGGLPEHARAASGMARHLGVVRNTCQRVTTALAEPRPSPSVLAQLPGVEGLHQFIDAARKAGADPGDTAAATAATEQFQSLLRELGGSQLRLVERLQAGPSEPFDTSLEPALCDEQARRQLFTGAVQCTGRYCDLTSSVYIFRPLSEDAARRERALLHAVVGYRARRHAMPLTFSAFVPRDGGTEPPVSLLDSTPAHGRTHESLLSRFSSSPLPTASARDDNGELVTIVDTESGEPGRAIDVVLANRSIHHPTPADLAGRPLRDVWKLINMPVKHLILDVYLHRRFAAACVPSIDVQLWGPNLDAPHRWASRLPGGPRLELLGAGLRNSPCPAYPRQAELTAYGFSELGWNPDEFVGFRCESPYPVWRAGYCMSFNPIA